MPRRRGAAPGVECACEAQSFSEPGLSARRGLVAGAPALEGAGGTGAAAAMAMPAKGGGASEVRAWGPSEARHVEAKP